MTERNDGVAETRRRYAPEVLANRLTRDDRWATPCRAYNACILPTTAEQAAFAEVNGGNAQVATVPRGAMTAFGNVGLPLTLLADH